MKSRARPGLPRRRLDVDKSRLIIPNKARLGKTENPNEMFGTALETRTQLAAVRCKIAGIGYGARSYASPLLKKYRSCLVRLVRVLH
jgi:hypothetical protein